MRQSAQGALTPRYVLSCRLVVEVEDEAALLKAMSTQFVAAPEMPEATQAFITSDVKSALQSLANPRAIVDGIPGVRFKQARYEAVIDDGTD